jgi:ribosomal protein L18
MSRPTEQEIKDIRDASKMESAYRKSLTNTEEAPAKDPRDVVRGQRGYAKGGSVSSRADGCAQRGKTKGTMVTMNRGGMSC